MFVTVPLGSSPEGIKFHELPLDINTSPVFAYCDAYVPAVITLYVYPSLLAAAVGREVIVPFVPRVPLNIIGSGRASIAALTAFDVGSVVSSLPNVVTIVFPDFFTPEFPLPSIIVFAVRSDPVTLFAILGVTDTVCAVPFEGVTVN